MRAPRHFRPGFLRALVTPRTRFSRVHSLFVLSALFPFPRSRATTNDRKNEGRNERIDEPVSRDPLVLAGRVVARVVFASRPFLHRVRLFIDDIADPDGSLSLFLPPISLFFSITDAREKSCR